MGSSQEERYLNRAWEIERAENRPHCMSSWSFWRSRKHMLHDTRKIGKLRSLVELLRGRQHGVFVRWFMVERSNFLYFRMYLLSPLKRRERKRRLPPLHARWESREQKTSLSGTAILADRKTIWSIPRVEKHRWRWCWFECGKQQTAWRFLVRIFGVKIGSLAEEHKIGCLLMKEGR